MKTNIFISIIVFLIVFMYVIIIKPNSIQYDVDVLCSNKKKLFCIGLGRTGTSSLSVGLLKLGYEVWHCPILNDSDNIRNYVNKFDALTELPFCCDYDFKDLYNMYPDAQFILTKRDEEKWLKSTIKYKRMMNIIIDKFPGYGMFTKNFKKFDFSIDSFREYNKDVLEFFEDKKEQLLVMDIPEGDGYEKLCKFLNVEYKDSLGKFPNIKEINLQLYLRMRYLFH